ncbi:MAG: T9SS type A sorting domain-containing protein [Candidatus Latescibacteria bacterium]|nr:T9SS type A sorting domain-containing protein [Candidatus Latescibacterota bacterium]
MASVVLAQETYPCDHRYGAVASWSQCTDTLDSRTRYDAELWAFKYNLPLTVFDSPFSIAITTDKVECYQTGRISWEVYFQTDRWAKPDEYEYPTNYAYYEKSKYPLIPDYFLDKWTEVGKHYFPSVTIGESKPVRYPDHGQELYDVSDGKYGYDDTTNTAGDIDSINGLIKYHCDWVKNILGCQPSCLSYRYGKVGARYAMAEWFLAGRNSEFYVNGRSRTVYGKSRITNLYLGYPNGYNFTHERAVCQPSSSRYWDSWKNPYTQPYFNTRDEALTQCETLLSETLRNGGWFNDFTHWHNTQDDDLDVFFAGQRRVIGEHDVFTGGYGDCMQHLFLRDSVESISTYWEGSVCVIEVHENELPETLPLSVFSIPLSVQIDLSGTVLEGKDICSTESHGIKKLGNDLYCVDVPFNGEEGFQIVKLAATDTPNYLDFQIPKIISINPVGKILSIKTDKPTRLALFWAPAGAPEYDVNILCRGNNLNNEHHFDFNDSSVLNYGGDMTWEKLKNCDIYIGAITETKQSVLSGVYHYGWTVVSVDIDSQPKAVKLNTCFPNPFNSFTVLRYELSEEFKISLAIYNISGQKIKTLIDTTKIPAGKYSLIWDSTDDNGALVSSGIYFVSLRSERYIASMKMLFIK